MSLRAIKYENNTLEILDQLLLPAQSKFIKVNGVEDGWKVINKMQVANFKLSHFFFWIRNLISFKVRGAPAIAIVGCLSLAVELRKEDFDNKKQLRQEIEGKLNYLVSSRPTAVNMKIAAEELITLANKLAEDDGITAEDMKLELVYWFSVSKLWKSIFF